MYFSSNSRSSRMGQGGPLLRSPQCLQICNQFVLLLPRQMQVWHFAAGLYQIRIEQPFRKIGGRILQAARGHRLAAGDMSQVRTDPFICGCAANRVTACATQLKKILRPVMGRASSRRRPV